MSGMSKATMSAVSVRLHSIAAAAWLERPKPSTNRPMANLNAISDFLLFFVTVELRMVITRIPVTFLRRPSLFSLCLKSRDNQRVNSVGLRKVKTIVLLAAVSIQGDKGQLINRSAIRAHAAAECRACSPWKCRNCQPSLAGAGTG